MDDSKLLILIKGKDKTEQIEYCNYNEAITKWDIKYKYNLKIYSYSDFNVNKIKAEAAEYISKNIIVYKDDIPLWQVEKVIHFRDYVKVFYKDGKKELYENYEIEIKKTALENKKSENCFNYFKEIAKEMKMTKNSGESENDFLEKQYEKLNFINPDSVLADYLHPNAIKENELRGSVIFPFGFNLSQKEATEKALCNKISVIEGPPGTGKTQTILNIISNVILKGKTVAVVSNNNAATMNVLEKLQKYDLDFIAAYLGKNENKHKFFDNQKTQYPDFKTWKTDNKQEEKSDAEIAAEQKKILSLLKKQVEMAKITEEYSDFCLEFNRFRDSYKEISSDSKLKLWGNISADKLRNLIFDYEQDDVTPSLLFKLRNFIKYHVLSFKFYNNDKEAIVNELRNAFYNIKHKELVKSIKSYENQLEDSNFKGLIKKYTDNSISLLKSNLANKFSGSVKSNFDIRYFKKVFKDFINEYPIVLSTTHSLKTCIPDGYLFDYVIIDESSQVDIASGALALSCAKNAVIVGDLKQLPNIVSKDFEEKCNSVLKKYNIKESYNCAKHSLLSSIISTYKDVSRTLLKEHYRCSPKIIGFCNKKFYDNELAIMTKETEDCPMEVRPTPEGNHERHNRNQRQVDMIKNEIIPNLDKGIKSIGIISPYRNQISLLKSQINDEDIKIDTVHKFQGQEKDVIILSTVANDVNDFIDDANLINVAVSRAKKRFILVTSDNKNENEDSNIADLIRYINYNKGDTIESKIHSVFDMMYKCNSDKLKEYLKNHKNVSKYVSENIIDELLDEILKDYKSFSKIMNYPLNMLIRDRTLLNEREEQFVSCPYSHSDFVIFNNMDKKPVLTIEVDGTAYHADNPEQLARDQIKDTILQKYSMPCLRLATDGSEEEKRIREKLDSILN